MAVPALGEVVELPPGRAGELLTLQRAAWLDEARLHERFDIPPLTQTLPELVDELARCRCLAVFDGHRLVGSVRAVERDGMLHVARLGVVPDLAGCGIGSRLLAAIEATTELPTATLFTGGRSVGNHEFYRRRGYVEQGRQELAPGLEVLRFDKALGPR